MSGSRNSRFVALPNAQGDDPSLEVLDQATSDRLRLGEALAPPMVVHLPSLGANDLEDTANFLIDNANLRVATNEASDGYGSACHPLIFDVDDTLLSERWFWLTFCETRSIDAVDYIVAYVRALINTETSEFESADRTYSVVGDEPLYAWLDTYLEIYNFDHPVPNGLDRFHDVFTDHLAALADLDHEVRQDAQITKLMDLSRVDTRRMARLMAVRFFSGQHGLGAASLDPERDRRCLHRHPGSFKMLVDYLVGTSTGDDPLGLPFSDLRRRNDAMWMLPTLCRAAYGSNPAQRDVYAYAAAVCEGEFDPEPAEYDLAFIAETDAYLQSSTRRWRDTLDTGFHVFEPTTNSWTVSS